MKDSDLRRSIEEVQLILHPLMEGEFSDKLYKVSVYVESIGKKSNTFMSISKGQTIEKDSDQQHKTMETEIKSFETSLKNSIHFARMNLDAAMTQALITLVKRPKNVNKSNEQRRKEALKRLFDEIAEPTRAMLNHFRDSPDPLDKYLVGGPWGHEYIRSRRVDLETYDRELCKMLSCSDSTIGRLVMNYSRLYKALKLLEDEGTSVARTTFQNDAE